MAKGGSVLEGLERAGVFRKKETERRKEKEREKKEFLAERSHLFEETRNTLAFS